MREKVVTKEQQAINELASLVSDLADVINDIGAIGFESILENIKNRAFEISNPKQ